MRVVLNYLFVQYVVSVNLSGMTLHPLLRRIKGIWLDFVLIFLLFKA